MSDVKQRLATWTDDDRDTIVGFLRTCWFEADIRIPPGLTREEILVKVREIIGRYPEATLERSTTARR